MRCYFVLTVFFLASCAAPPAGPQSSATFPASEQTASQAPVVKTGPDDDGKNPWPQMTVELVTTHSPEALHALWTYLDLSEAGYDGFCEDYARALEPETDRRFPAVARIRSHIVEAFDSARNVQRLITGGGTGFGHEHFRLAGKVEHAIYFGFRYDFPHCTQSECTLQEVERTLMEIEKDFEPTEFDDAAERAGDIKQAKNQCMAALRNAEAELDEPGRQYFRFQLVVYMHGWLRDEEADLRPCMDASAARR